MKNVKKKLVVLKGIAQIPYVWKTEMWGRAEFVVCPIWKRGKIVELYIYPMQQDSDKYYKLKCNGTRLGIGSWTYQGIEEPKVWNSYWCSEHKCMTLEFYVSPNTSHLEIDAMTSYLDLRCAK